MVVSSILNLLWFFIKFIGIPVLVIVVLVVIFKTIVECRKYGKSVFSAFKTRDISNARDELLHISLDKITWYKKIVKPSFLKSNYVLIDGNGISIFKVFTQVGYFDGTVTSKYLYYRSNGREYRICNPVLSLNKDEMVMKRLFPDTKINKYLVLTEGTYVNVMDGVNQINFNKLPYGLPENHHYIPEEIDALENKLVSKSV